MIEKAPAVPRGLKATGRGLWNSTVREFELDEHDLGLLREACRTADALDALQAALDRDGVLDESPQGRRAHPALVELRQQRICFARLVASWGCRLVMRTAFSGGEAEQAAAACCPWRVRDYGGGVVRRRRDDDSTPPPELLVFEGWRFTTAAEWEAAFKMWWDARDLWASQRGLDILLPQEVIGDCPFDPTTI